MTLDENISQLRDALTVTSAMTLRHETLLKDHAEWLQAHDRAMLELDARTIQHERNMERIELALERVDLGLAEATDKLNTRMARHEAIMERVELGLAEATDKLNALIDIVDGRHRSS